MVGPDSLVASSLTQDTLERAGAGISLLLFILKQVGEQQKKGALSPGAKYHIGPGVQNPPTWLSAVLSHEIIHWLHAIILL